MKIPLDKGSRRWKETKEQGKRTKRKRREKKRRQAVCVLLSLAPEAAALTLLSHCHFPTGMHTRTNYPTKIAGHKPVHLHSHVPSRTIGIVSASAHHARPQCVPQCQAPKSSVYPYPIPASRHRTRRRTPSPTTDLHRLRYVRVHVCCTNKNSTPRERGRPSRVQPQYSTVGLKEARKKPPSLAILQPIMCVAY